MCGIIRKVCFIDKANKETLVKTFHLALTEKNVLDPKYFLSFRSIYLCFERFLNITPFNINVFSALPWTDALHQWPYIFLL